MQKITYREQIQILAQMQARLNALDELVLGVTALLGREEVLQAAKDARADERRRMDEGLAAQIARGVEQGWLTPAKVSGLASLVVGEEALPDGTKSRLQVIPAEITPAHRGQYLGREVGETFEAVGPAGKFPTSVTAIYEVDEDRRRAAAAAAAAAEKALPPAPPEGAPPEVPA